MSTAASLPLLRRFGLSPVNAVSVLLCTAGLLLGVTANMAFMILFAAGAFGPPLLRELGILRDLDEFQRELTAQAARRAYVVAGLFLCGAIVARQWGEANLDHDSIPAHAALVCLIVTYYLSYLTGYWGPQRAAARILVTFGVVWGTFVLLSHGGEAAAGKPMATLAEMAVVLPFFALAWACGRWPRAAGVLLVLAGAGTFTLFQGWRALQGDTTSMVVQMTFTLPLVFCGLALLGGSRSREDGDAS